MLKGLKGLKGLKMCEKRKLDKSEFALQKVQPVLAPENLAIQHVAGRAENMVVNCLLGIGVVLRLHRRAVRLCQPGSVQPAICQQTCQRGVIGNIALVRPDSAENCTA